MNLSNSLLVFQKRHTFLNFVEKKIPPNNKMTTIIIILIAIIAVWVFLLPQNEGLTLTKTVKPCCCATCGPSDVNCTYDWRSDCYLPPMITTARMSCVNDKYCKNIKKCCCAFQNGYRNLESPSECWKNGGSCWQINECV